MPVSINALNVGDVVYDAQKTFMGNTKLRRLSVWRVLIISVDLKAQTVVASWNGNQPKTYRAKSGKLPWRRTKPKEPPLPSATWNP